MAHPLPPEFFRPSLTYPRIPYGEMLARPVALAPDREAIVAGATSVTFRELEGLVNALAHGLRGLGIERGDRVCLFMTNRPEYIIAFFALARLGAVPSPMNPSYKEREVAYQLVDAQAVAIITQSDLAPVVRAARAETPGLSTSSSSDRAGMCLTACALPISSPVRPRLCRRRMLSVGRTF